MDSASVDRRPLSVDPWAAFRAAVADGRLGAAEEAARALLDGERAATPAQRAEVWLELARLYRGAARWPEAEEACRAARRTAAHGGAAEWEGKAINELGWVYQLQGRLDEAERCYRAAGALARRHELPWLLAAARHNRAIVASLRGDRRRSVARFAQAALAFERLGAWKEAAIVWKNRAETCDLLGWRRAAARSLARAQDAARRADDPRTTGLVALMVARHALRWRRPQAAEAPLAVARRVLSAVGPSVRWPEVELAEAELRAQRGERAAARRHLRRAIALARRYRVPHLEAEAHRERARLCAEDGQLRLALACLTRSHAAFRAAQAQGEIPSLKAMQAQLEALFADLAQRWGDRIEAADGITAGHCRRVADLALGLAARVGVGPEAHFWLRIGGLLHDVGKIEVRPEVLGKPGPLTPEERREMELHTVYGDRILQGMGMPDWVAAMARHHHERWDGRGYPDGLAGERIPFEARLLAVVDIFDALTSDRQYRPALPVAEALRILREERGKGLDPTLVDAFCAWIEGSAAAPAAARAN